MFLGYFEERAFIKFNREKKVLPRWLCKMDNSTNKQNSDIKVGRSGFIGMARGERLLEVGSKVKFSSVKDIETHRLEQAIGLYDLASPY